MTRLYSQVFGVEAPAFMAWSIFPAPSGFWPHTMRGALFAGVWGGSPAFMAWSIFPASSRFWPHNMRGALYSQVFGVEALPLWRGPFSPRRLDIGRTI